MKFNNYLNEISKKGWGITFIDIDETIFKTFAKVFIVKDGKVIKKLSNQEFNNYVLKDGESFDYGEFRSAKFFKETSIPIEKTIKRIKKMMNIIKDKPSKIIFLTARTDFDDKNIFLQTFEEYGINMDKSNVYVERSGNIKTGTIEDKKKQVILKYLKSGIYRRVRLIDDYMGNLKVLLNIRDNLSKEIENKVRNFYNLNDDEKAIEFWALLATSDGTLKEIR